MYIHLPGRHYDINLFHLKSLFQCPEQSLPSLSIFCFFRAVSRRYGVLLRLHPPVYLVQSYTYTGCFSSTSKVFFCQQLLLGRFEWFLARVSGSAVSSEFKFLDTQNLTCLQLLPNTLYTNY